MKDRKVFKAAQPKWKLPIFKGKMVPFAETLNPFPIYISDTEINVIIPIPKSSPSPYYYLRPLISCH